MAKWSGSVQDTESSADKKHCLANKRLLIALIIGLILFIIIIGLLAGLLSRSKSQSDLPNETEPWKSVYLRSYVRPTHYDIHMYPEFYTENDSSFKATETITIQIDKPTKYIILHYLKIDILETQITDVTNGRNALLQISRNFTHVEHDYWVIETSEVISSESEIKVYLNFTGSVGHNMISSYKGYFVDKFDNTTKYLISTQFEPAYARMAFPSFDEPPFKAYYTMHMTHCKTHTALFNSELDTQSRIENRSDIIVSHFQRTEYIMSSYLVAWAVFESYSDVTETQNDRLMRYFAPTYRVEELDYAKSVGFKIRNYFDKLLDFKSPLAKVDMISIPQFEAGAMENWGLITYRESLLLFNNYTDLDTSKYHISRVIAHELVHTWFGNIVTMDWWQNLWLNEAFATHFADLGNKAAQPHWDVFAYSVLLNRVGTMQRESIEDALPIIQNVSGRSEMKGMFNSFVYKKGGQILQWVQNIMGINNFMNALKEYIKEFQYKTANTANLMHFFDKYPLTEGQPVSTLMYPWLHQKGYPVIYLSLNQNNKTITAMQWANFYDPSNTTNSHLAPFNYKWNVPLPFITSEESTDLQNLFKTLTNTSRQINFNLPSSFSINSSWILVNPDSSGYYRVIYDSHLFKNIINQLIVNHTAIKPLQKALLIDDTFTSISMNYITYNTSLLLLDYIGNDNSYEPWAMLEPYIRNIDTHVDTNGTLRRFMANATQKIFDAWNDDTVNPGIPLNERRVDFLFLSCYFGNENCLNYTLSMFHKYVTDSSQLDTEPIEVHKWILYFGIQQDDSKWGDLFQKFKTLNEDSPDRLNLQTALWGTNSKANIENLLIEVTKSTNIRNITADAIASFMRGVYNLDANKNKWTWEWLKTNCKSNSTPRCQTIISIIPFYCGRYFNTQALLTNLKMFLKNYNTNFNTLFDRVNFNIKWSLKYENEIVQYFQMKEKLII